jgi:hypothetical protein
VTTDDLIKVILANDGGTCHAFGQTHCYNDPTAKWEGRRCYQCEDWAERILNTIVPPIAEAIGKAIYDTAFEVFIDMDGDRSIRVDKNQEGLAQAAGIARAWRPSPPVPMRDKREESPLYTPEMVAKGQVWVGIRHPDGSHEWEIRGTGMVGPNDRLSDLVRDDDGQG